MDFHFLIRPLSSIRTPSLCQYFIVKLRIRYEGVLSESSIKSVSGCISFSIQYVYFKIIIYIVLYYKKTSILLLSYARSSIKPIDRWKLLRYCLANLFLPAESHYFYAVHMWCSLGQSRRTMLYICDTPSAHNYCHIYMSICRYTEYL